MIPTGADVETMEVIPLGVTELARNVRVLPAQPMRTFAELEAGGFEPAPPNLQVYASDQVYPTEPLSIITAGSKAGFRLAGFLYCPFQYQPVSGRLSLVTKARIRVIYRENVLDAPVLTPSQSALAAEDVARLVLNAGDIHKFGPMTSAKLSPETDIVMFTSPALAPSLVGIRTWLQRKGYFTEIVLIDTINQPGRDRFEKMRNLLKRKFAEEGLKYVILAGDVDQCSLRYGWLPHPTHYIPADMYFGDLDGSWDANCNDKFGEMDGDSVDLFHDIYVGRLPLDSAQDAAKFLAKDTTYEIHPDTSYLNNVLLAHEVMWDFLNYHGGICNRNIAQVLNSQAAWEVDSGLNIGSTRVTNGLNAGRHFFHFAGHGQNDKFGSTYSSSYLRFLTNTTRPCIVYSVACFTGCFDMPPGDCLGEKFLNLQAGAVATMLPARYGWGAPPCMGPNELFDVIFTSNYLSGMNLGRAHGLTRDFLRNESFSQMPTRYCLYVQTLLGDPTMTLWRRPPQPLVVTHPSSIPAGPQMLEIQVSSSDGPVRNARVAVLHSGELLGRAETDLHGRASVPLSTLNEGWQLDLYVTGQDVSIYRATLTVHGGASAPLPVLHRNLVNDPNGRLDPGEESDLRLVVKNRGNATAENLTGILSSTSPYVTITRDTAFYGTLQSGDTAAGTGYRVLVSSACPHGSRLDFSLSLRTGTQEWKTGFELIAGLPNARPGIWATLDTGDYCLAVCANGGIGTTEYRGEGFGFIYPKARRYSTSALMHGSFLIGIDSSWVVDNYYGSPDWTVCPQDFALHESIQPLYPPERGNKEFVAAFTDACHPRPRNVLINHRAFGSARPAHKDFVILEYRIQNRGSSSLSNLYAGVICDFRTPAWNVNDSFDYAGTDSLRKLAFVKSAASGETLALGIRHIYPAAPGFANCLNEWSLVWDGFTKKEKMGFLNGELRSIAGTSAGNWSAMVSSGPYTIAPGNSQIVAFALCGAPTEDLLRTVSDTAANWYSPRSAVLDSHCGAAGLRLFPTVFRSQLTVEYSQGRPGLLDLAAYDASGRLVALFRPAATSAAGKVCWQPELKPGVYFIRTKDCTAKVTKIE